MIPELFVFDMIGTTVEPSDAIPEAFVDAFSAVGLELTTEQVTKVRGKSKRVAIAELLAIDLDSTEAKELQDRVYESFQNTLLAHYRDGAVHPIEGARITFDWCHSVGANVALTTGLDHDVAGMLISRLGWDEIMDAVVCNDDVVEGRPAPHLIHEAMARTETSSAELVAGIGDTVSDLQAGENAGVAWNFAVLTGAHDVATLSEIDGAIILESVADLPEYRW
jgi:phosphonatase-like hydrolase